MEKNCSILVYFILARYDVEDGILPYFCSPSFCLKLPKENGIKNEVTGEVSFVWMTTYKAEGLGNNIAGIRMFSNITHELYFHGHPAEYNLYEEYLILGRSGAYHFNR